MLLISLKQIENNRFRHYSQRRSGIIYYTIINSHPDMNINAVVDIFSLVLCLLEKYSKVYNIFVCWGL